MPHMYYPSTATGTGWNSLYSPNFWWNYTASSSVTAYTLTAIDYVWTDDYVISVQDTIPTPRTPQVEAPAVLVTSAAAKAERLLMDHLSPEQRMQYEQYNFFDVEVNGNRYRIHDSWAGNVRRLTEQGRQLESICIHFSNIMPIPDLMLAQKLMLETDEAEFRRLANITRCGLS